MQLGKSKILEQIEAEVQGETPKVIKLHDRVGYYLEHKKVIDTLYLTIDFEVDVLGLYVPSVALDVLQCRKWEKLHDQLKQVIETCLVKDVVLVLSKNITYVSESDVKAKNDLSKPLNNYFQSISRLRTLLKETKTAPTLYTSFIKPNDGNHTPTLKDVLLSDDGINKAAFESLRLYNKPSQTFFESIKLNFSTKTLYRAFNLHDVKAFYDINCDLIEDAEFYYKGDLYQYGFNHKNERVVKLLKPKWAERLIWVGDTYYETIEAPIVTPAGAKVATKKVLEERKQATLSKLYGNDFAKYIEYYQKFVNVPSHTDYKPVIKTETGQFINRYFPFEWEPKEGRFDTILKFLKHIFGHEEKEYKGKNIKSWELGLDYIKILLEKPYQRLPIICLYSPENNTGKSTFALLLSTIFKNNCVAVSNHDFESPFGSSIFYDKLIAYCEETQLDKISFKDKIKNISTAPTISVNQKFGGMFQGETFVKFIFMSNNKRMLPVNDEDQRFWILRVPKVPKEEQDPRMVEKMVKEIPAFIDFLQNRKMVAPYAGRMWFDPSLIVTDEFRSMAKLSEHSDVKELRYKLAEYFTSHTDVQELIVPTEIIQKYFLKRDTNWLNEILRDRIGLSKLLNKKGVPKTTRAKFKWWNDGAEAAHIVRWKPAQCWIFPRRLFVDDEGEPQAEQQPETDDTPF